MTRPAHLRSALRTLLVFSAAVLRAEAGPHATEAAPEPHHATATPPAAASAEHPPAAAAEPVRVAMQADEAASLLTLGATFAERADYAAAEIAYRQILDRPGFSAVSQYDALFGLARMYRKQGTFIKAAAIYERLLKDHPEDERSPDVLLDLGRTFRTMGAPKLALNRFYSVINSTLKLSSDGFAHYQLLARTAQFEIAETHYGTGNFAEAGKFFLRLRLLDLAPADRARAHFKAACAQQLDRDFESAVTTLRSYLEQWPEDENVPEARYLLATTLRQLNRTEAALAVTLELLQTEQARTAADPRRWAYWQRRTGNQLANEFFSNGDTQSALTIYQGLASMAQEPAWRLPVLYQVALCYERLHQAGQARATYEAICTATTPAAGQTAPAAELADLARMAAWRLSQLDWRDRTDRRLNTFFDTTTGRIPAVAPAPAPAPTHDTDGNPPAAPATL